MRLLLLAAFLVPAAASAAPFGSRQPVTPPGMAGAANCPTKVNHFAHRRGEPVKPRKLTQLPRADAYAAVLRHVDGCDAPLILTRGTGAKR